MSNDGRRIRPRHLLEYAALRGLSGLATWLPDRWARALGSAAGEFVYRVLRVRRRVVEENLSSTIGRLASQRDLSRIARATYRHLGQTLVEHGRLLRIVEEQLDQVVTLEGTEHLDAALSLGRGAIVVGAHFGHWELLAAALSSRGYPLHVIAKPQRNPLVHAHLKRTRQRMGYGLFHTGVEMRGMLRELRRGQLLGILADQDAGPGGVFVDFLGRPASVQQGPAVFAVRTGAPIVPGYIVREAGGRHRGTFEPPIAPDRDADETAEIERLVRAYAGSLERRVLRHPEQWYWVHRRWKTRPPAEPPRSAPR